MNKSTQFIINYDKKNTIKSLVVIFFILIIMIIGLVYFFNENLSLVPMFPFLDFLILFFLKTLFSFGIVLFFFGLILGIYSFFDNRPAAILDKKGIWIKHYNFILWEDIIDFDLLAVSIGINVKNPIILSRRSNLGGKMGIFWSKLFNYHHINIYNVQIPLYKIFDFANIYINKT